MVIFCQDNLFRIRPKTNKYKPTKHYIQLGFHLRIYATFLFPSKTLRTCNFADNI